MPVLDIPVTTDPVIDLLTRRGIMGAPTKTGAIRYDLDALLVDPSQPAGAELPHYKITLFKTPTKYTFAKTIRVVKYVHENTPRERSYNVWEKQWSVSLSGKTNLDGQGSFNLYAHGKSRGLQNLTSRPQKILPMLPAAVVDLFLLCARDVHERLLGLPWRTFGSGAATDPADVLLYNTYPAYFVDEPSFPRRRDDFLTCIPSALYPLLRQDDPAAVIDRLFGADAPVEFYELAVTGLAPHLLVGGYLFGRRSSGETLLSLAGVSADLPLIKYLHELRQLLGRCDQASFERLRNHYLQLVHDTKGFTALMARFDQLFNGLKKSELPKGAIKFRAIPIMSDVQTFDDLATRLQTHVGLLRDQSRTATKATADALLKKIGEVFVLSEPGEQVGYWLEVNPRDGYSVELCHRSRTDQLISSRMRLFQLESHQHVGKMLVAGSLAGPYTQLPARHGLYNFFVKQRSQNILVNSMVEYRLAAEFLAGFAASLRRIAKRHGLPQDAATITNLLVLTTIRCQQFITHNRSGQRLRRPAISAHLYDYLRAITLPIDTVLFGIKWDLPPTLAQRYLRQLPASFLRDLVDARAYPTRFDEVDDPF